MRVAPICECITSPTTLVGLWDAADAVLRIRITGHDANAPDRKHIATALTVWKATPTVKATDTVTFLQRIEQNEIEPYAIGQEFVIFLQWSPQLQAFVRWSNEDGTVAAFAIEGGRIHSAPMAGYSGMDDEQLMKELSSLVGR
jgi:hypothetical protein